MAILERFADIIKANINSIIDNMEDPSKMIDQYLRDMLEDLAEVKRNTASVIAEETRTKRLVDENAAEVAKYSEYAKKALQANNEGDARTFITKKQELENIGADLTKAYSVALENAVKIRQLHDKLSSDIETLKSRKEMIKAKVSVAKTQQTINEANDYTTKTESAKKAFERMEGKAERMLDETNAMAELNKPPKDEASKIEDKYASSGSVSVEDELDKLKKELGK